MKHAEVCLYPEQGWTAEKIVEVLSARKSVQRYALMLHDQDSKKDGTPVKPHFHVYINFGKTSWELSAIAKWFDVENKFVSRVKTNEYIVLRYYTHQGYPEKCYYPVDRFIANFDVASYLKNAQEKNQGRRMSEQVRVLIDQCANGTIMPYEIEKIPPEIYARYAPLLERAWEQERQKRMLKQYSTRESKIIWAFGATGCGKTSLGKMLAQKLQRSLYLTHGGNDPFDSYRSQPFVLLDDVRPNVPFSFSDLLKLLDPYTVSGVHSRYRDKYLNADTIFITSTFSPEDFYKGSLISNADVDTASQLFRRLDQVWWVRKSCIDIQKYNLESRVFVSVDQKKNPIPALLEKEAMRQESTSCPAMDVVLQEIISDVEGGESISKV